MALNQPKSFTALLEPDGTALHWTIARVPFHLDAVWPKRKGRRVRGTVGQFPFRTSLFPDPRGSGHILLVNKRMQAGAGVRLGDRVRITLEPDMEERETLIPSELSRELSDSPALRRWSEALSPSMRREIAKWVTEPKTAETRRKRAARMAVRLMQAMEGETDPPPVLRARFQRQPAARAGWEAMTPAQRRNHLLGIFYYETPEARERRAAKAIEDALRAAERLHAHQKPAAATGRLARSK